MTTSDILANADAFRAAYPSWPHASEVTATADPQATFRERNQWLRQSLAGRIEVLTPDETEADLNYAAEKADYTEGD